MIDQAEESAWRLGAWPSMRQERECLCSWGNCCLLCGTQIRFTGVPASLYELVIERRGWRFVGYLKGGGWAVTCFLCLPKFEDEVRVAAYFLWEKNRSRSELDIWHEAKYQIIDDWASRALFK